MNHYILRGGVEGKQRLEVLARVMWPTTSRALERVGLSRGMTCLDLGCGGGDVTFKLARWVGPEGRVVGMDCDEVKIELAREAMELRHVSNIEFRVRDIDGWAADSEYDFIYCRFLLTHLKNPSSIVRRTLRAARPGGIVLVEDIDFAGSIWHPPSAALERYVRFYQMSAARRGCDANIGPKLYLMLLDAGWKIFDLDVVQPTHFTGEGKQIALLTLINIADAVEAEHLASRSELDATIVELTHYTENPRTLVSLPRVFQVGGRKAES